MTIQNIDKPKPLLDHTYMPSGALDINVYHRLFFEVCDDALLVVDQGGNCIAANPTACRIFSISCCNTHNLLLTNFLSPTLASSFMLYMHHARMTGKPQQCSYQFTDQQAITRYQDAKFIANGQTQILIVIRDITEQKWLEESARISKQYVRHLLSDLPVGVLIFGADAEILLSNQAACTVLGLTETQLLSPQFDATLQILTEEETGFAGFIPLVKQVITTGQAIYNTMIGIPHAETNETRWLLVNAEPEVGFEGTSWVVVTLNDITDLRNTETALRQSEELYHSLVNTIYEVLFQVDTEGSWMFLNPAWSQITGFSVAESIGRCFLDFIHPDEQAAVKTAFLAVASGEQSDFYQEARCQTKRGDYRSLSIHGKLLESLEGLPYGVTGVIVDITERKFAETQAAELVSKERTVAALRNLLNYVSHDLRTPLSVLTINLYLLRQKLTQTDPACRYLNIVEQQTNRITQIVGNITTLFRLDNGLEPFDFTPVHLNQLVQDILEGQMAAITAKEIVLRSLFAPNLPLLKGDSLWLATAVKHLVANAVHYTDAHGIITVSTECVGDGALLQISDTGCGISADKLSHIFEWFFRVDSARATETGGSGLGLTIVKKVVEAHDGAVEAESVVGKGSTFRVKLPYGAATPNLAKFI